MADPDRWLDPHGLLGAWVLADQEIVGYAVLVAVESDVGAREVWRSVDLDPGELAAVSRLFVEPGRMGRGHGRTMLDTAASAAAARHRPPVLDVVDNGKPAAGIYEHLGWHRVTTAPWRVVNGVPLDRHFYVAPAGDRRVAQ